MESTLSMKDYVDARDDATSARLAAALEKGASKQTVWVATATIIGVTLAVLAFGSSVFNGGMSVSPLISEFQAKQVAIDKDRVAIQAKRDEAQDIQIAEINRKLDLILVSLSASDEDRPRPKPN